VEEQDGQPVPRRLAGIDLGIASRHSVRVLEAGGQVAGRSSCVPAVESLSAVEQAALAGAPEGTRLAVVSGSGWAGVDADRGVLRPPRARWLPGVVGEGRGLAPVLAAARCRTVLGHLQEAGSRIDTGNRRAGAGSEKGGVAGTAPKVQYSLAGPERSPLDGCRSSGRQLCGGRFIVPGAPVDGGRWLSTAGHGCSLPECSPV